MTTVLFQTQRDSNSQALYGPQLYSQVVVQTVPGVPTITSVIAGDNSVTINFTPPSNGGSAITGYLVTSSNGQQLAATGENNTITMTLMPANVPVSFTMHAINGVGPSAESARSATVIPLPSQLSPSAPLNVTATAGVGNAVVTFAPPANINGAPVTGYTIVASTGQLFTTSGSPATVTVPPAIPVFFTVYASNAYGNGTVSLSSNTVTPLAQLTLPTAPLNIRATAGINSVTVAFDPPASVGSASIQSYTVTASTGQVATGSQSPVTIQMPSGVPATFTAHATTSVGAGPESVPSVQVTALEAPDTTAPVMPSTVDVVNLSYNSATIAWQPASDNKGVTGYGYSVNGGVYTLIGGLSANLTGLQPETSYTINVRAYDAANNASAPVTVVFRTHAAPIQQTGTYPIPANQPRTVYIGVKGFPVGHPNGVFNMVGRPKAEQDPTATLDYVFDWTDYLAATGSKLKDSEWTLTSGTLQTYDYDPTASIVWVAGPGSQGIATLTNKITTDGTPPRVDERSILIKFKDQ